jgi:hypothetical protein
VSQPRGYQPEIYSITHLQGETIANKNVSAKGAPRKDAVGAKCERTKDQYPSNDLARMRAVALNSKEVHHGAFGCFLCCIINHCVFVRRLVVSDSPNPDRRKSTNIKHVKLTVCVLCDTLTRYYGCGAHTVHPYRPYRPTSAEGVSTGTPNQISVDIFCRFQCTLRLIMTYEPVLSDLFDQFARSDSRTVLAA